MKSQASTVSKSIHFWPIERAFIWAGVAMALLFTLGVWTLCGFIPPPAPTESAAEITARYVDHPTAIVAGSLLVLLAAGLYLPFCAALSTAMERHCEGTGLLCRAQFGGAISNVLFFSLIGLLWMVAAYRSDAGEGTIQLANDLTWLIMVVPTLPFVIQAVSVGVVALAQPDGEAVLPRWCGYFNFWCALLVVPGMLSGFFRTGVLAWNGLLSFWLEVIAFLIWLVVMVVVLDRALIKARTRHLHAE